MKNIFLIILLLFYVPLLSQWSSDPSENTYVREVGFPQQVVSDGRGGIIIGFQANSLMIIRVDSAGYVHWGPLGMFLTENWENYYALDLNLVPVGRGVTWASWTDLTGSSYPDPPVFDSLKVRYQRIEPDGSLLYDEAPLVCPVEGLRGWQWEEGSMMVEDGEGGVIIAFQDSRRDTLNYDYVQDIYAQRISNDGEIMWGDSGKLVFGEPNWKRTIYWLKGMISDGFGGAYVLVYRSTNYAPSEPDSLYNRLFLQRISSEGELLWQEGGVMVRESYDILESQRRFVEMIPDNSGGVFITFVADSGAIGSNPKPYIQRIDSNGLRLWGDEAMIFMELPKQSGISIGGDGFQGLYITWWDTLASGEGHNYTQHLNGDGEILWDIGGVSISTYPSNKSGAVPISNGEGGIIYLWSDERNIDNYKDIYAQRLNFSGDHLWDSVDVAVSTRPELQYPDKVSAENGNIFVVWYEIGAGSGFGIFAQLLNRNGVLGEPLTVIDYEHHIPWAFQLSQNYPNPFNAETSISYCLSEKDQVQISVYDLMGRLVIELVSMVQEPGIYRVSWNGLDKFGDMMSSGVYFYQLKAVSGTETKKMILMR